MTLERIFGNAEWQTVLLYSGAAIFIFCAFLIWQQKSAHPWQKFHVVGIIADLDEDNCWRLVATKVMAFGAFVISSIGVVVCVIRGQVPAEFVALLTIYGGIYVLGRLGDRQINSNAEINIRRAEINRGRRVDVDLTVEEEESQRLTVPRRRSTDSVFK